jgi:predicted transcriptional regulator of viral defense system
MDKTVHYVFRPMQLSNLLATLDRLDRMGIWCVSLPTLQVVFREDRHTILKSLARHQLHGVIQRVARSLYVNPRARCMPPDVLGALVPFLRPWDSCYLSLESVLSEAGWISQIPNRLTLMTTGREYVFETPYGVVEFVHTKQTADQLRADVTTDERREFPVATPRRALRDLKRVGRNMDLVTVPEDADDANPN